MKIKEELRNTLSLQSTQVPRPWMLIVGLGTLIPLLLGVFRNETELCIFGGLAGYLLGLCTEAGSLWHRIKVALFSIISMSLMFGVGLYLQQSIWIFFLIGLLLTYAIGILAGKGAEVERLFIFSAVNFFIAKYATYISINDYPIILMYMLTAFIGGVFANIFASFLWPFINESHVRIRDSVAQLKTKDRIRHYYAITYTSAVAFAMCLDQWSPIERGYWMVITVLLIMRPTRRESFQRVTQRVFGTFLGGILGAPFIFFHFLPLTYVLGAAFFATLVPFIWKRNYWLVSMCVTVFIICLLEIATHGSLDIYITLARVRSTLYGCAISVIVIFLFHWLRPNWIEKKTELD